MMFQEKIDRETAWNVINPSGANIKRGDRGLHVTRVQEWLCLRGRNVALDGDFGPATEAALRSIYGKTEVDRLVWTNLITPMRDAVDTNYASTSRSSLASWVTFVAKQHLTSRPREVGGQNKGPWVRLYMDGNEGVPWAWCAGFVSFIYEQACVLATQAMPFKRTYSCDDLARQAKQAGKFMSVLDRPKLTVGSLFLVERSPIDWVHTGLVTGVHEEYFTTIEGNTNDDGSREGYEVCARTRGYKNNDFFVL